MHDARIVTLATSLIRDSVRLKPGEQILIDAHDAPREMVIALVRAARAAGGVPHINLVDSRIQRELVLGASADQYDAVARYELDRMKGMHAYIAIRASRNITEMADVPSEKMRLVAAKLKPVMDRRIRQTKWCVLRWPTPSMAQQADMSTEAFEDFYFRVCTLDYRRMRPGMEALRRLMERTDRVEITGPGTDLRFSIAGIGVIPCGGTFNIPDGEVFTAPVRDSVEGHISFNAPTVYQGVAFDRVRLEFRRGRIVAAEANDGARLNQILDSDAGARHIGEFALGFNPHILHPIRDILFDEKIAGSFHFTPGQAYEEADNGNRSQVHWDLVCIQRPDYGGGEIRFDGKLIRKDGLFLPAPLQKLNPDWLLAERAGPAVRRR